MNRNHPEIFDTADKRLKFTISNVGEFIDSAYREVESNDIFNRLIGRHSVVISGKKEFTAADVVCEGYLYKKGSWRRNWKRRYFILRKDIRAIHYYVSREDMTLLGAIDLDIDTRVANIRPDDPEADGFQNVIRIEADGEGDSQRTYIRFETFEKMKAWMVDIKNESQNMAISDEDQVEWWTALFAEVPTVEAKHVAKRDAVTNDHDTAEDLPRFHKDGISHSGKIERDTSSGKGSTSVGTEQTVCDSDSESDNEEDINKKEKRKSANSTFNEKFLKKIKNMKQDKPYGPPPFEDCSARKYEVPIGEHTALSGLQISLRLSNVCTHLDRLMVVIYGGFPASTSSSSSSPASPETSHKVALSTTNALANTQQVLANQGHRYRFISRTEVRTVGERPSYSESFVSEVKLFFHALALPAGLEDCKDIRLHVLRIDNEGRGGDGTVNNSASSTSAKQRGGGGGGGGVSATVAKCVIARRLLDFKSILKIKMKVVQQPVMDIAVPLLKEPEVLLGLVKLTSFQLQSQRTWMTNKLQIQPYSEVLYSFGGNAGLTLSLEQLYASRYSTAVGQALVSLWSQEREESLRTLKEEFAKFVRDVETRHVAQSTSPCTHNDSSNIEERRKEIEAACHALEGVDELHMENRELSQLVIDEYQRVSRGVDLKNNVIGADVGGGVLRRSTWKKVTVWQYCTTNLNVHLLTSRYFTFAEAQENSDQIISPDGQRIQLANQRKMHVVPTITLGCPAAHELKFSEGGLRRIFNDIPTIEQKLKWLQAIQSPTLTLLEELSASHSREAMSLFGAKFLALRSSGAVSSSSSMEDKATILHRKYELARRIDICASQALGCCVTNIRTILLLATSIGGSHFDTLARSLKIGFLVMFESMLSTQGAEVGMIEDLEVAAMWLSLVTIRLVTNTKASSDAGVDGSSGHSHHHHHHHHRGSHHISSAEGVDRKASSSSSSLCGFGEGITCRRSLSGRLVCDIEVTVDESVKIQEAQRYMRDFEFRQNGFLPSTCSFAFTSEPAFAPEQKDPTIVVHAVVEAFGLAFTQGVNEMQTLANMSSSRDVLKQIEINQSSLARLREHYPHYRAALSHQLDYNRDDMALTLLSGANGNTSTNRQSTAQQKGPTRRKSTRNSLHGAGLDGANSKSVNRTVEQLISKVLQYNDRLLDQLEEVTVTLTDNPYEKHVDLLLKSSAICRQISGMACILCKSGKDRTSMGVTLENTKNVVEDLGILNGRDCCDLMRMQGVRRMNVFANTGQSMFAFNQIQRRALPNCYRPPTGTHSGNVTT